MASSDSAPPILSVDSILAFSDAELVQYMKQNRRADGGFDLDVDGWEHLPKDRRDQLAERLKAGAQQANDAVESRPVDFDQVVARLHQLSDTRDTLPRALYEPSRHDRAPTEDVDFDAERKRSETFAYNDLLDDGGQPAYPIDDLEAVSKDPENYRDLLRPWEEHPHLSPPSWSRVFQNQLTRWRDFRQWQLDNRGLQDDERQGIEFVERHMLWMKRQGLTWMAMFPQGDYLEARERDWKNYRTKCEYDRYWLRESHGSDEFPEYLDEVRRRLMKHDFTRAFQLDEDPKRQDKLKTWIEYLGYEYAWYDRYTRLFTRLEPKYDDAWRTLENSGVLRTDETDESISTTASALRRQSEEDQARAAVKAAEAAVFAALGETQKAKQGRSGLPKKERIRRLTAAHSKLISAQRALKAIKTRNNLITEFVRKTLSYYAKKRDVYRHSLLLPWILAQVPVIEAELNKVNQNENALMNQASSLSVDAPTPETTPSKHSRPDEPVCGGRRLKRGRPDDAECHGPSSKRLRTESREAGSDDLPSVGHSQEPGMQTGKPPKIHTVPSTHMPKPPATVLQPRRSARLAAGSRTTTARQLGFQNSQRQDAAKVQGSRGSQGPRLRPKRRAASARGDGSSGSRTRKGVDC